jgi:ectoine hydroxylase-related dioxygenase (phytanoyl-CoA dioxygenase family)
LLLVSEGIREEVLQKGFAIIPKILGEGVLDNLDTCMRDADYGQRNLLAHPEVREVAASREVRLAVSSILGKDCFAVRAILFDKTEDANWKVPWHQDRVIAVNKRIEVSGFGLWSVKAGVDHVQPHPEMMSRMLAVRIHLDDCGEENGPLRVLPGSHNHGFLDSEQIDAWRQKIAIICAVSRGDAILMRPLLLHASSPCAVPHHRRVIHIEFAAEDLPGGLEWNDRVQ